MSVSIAALSLLYDKESDEALTGSVYRLDKTKGGSYLCDIVVPMFDQSRNTDHVRIGELDHLDEGSYLLQLMLPNGDMHTETFNIANDEDDPKIRVYIPHDGPHEWTSMHAMAGYFKHAKPPVLKTASHPQTGQPIRITIPSHSDFKLSFETGLRPQTTHLPRIASHSQRDFQLSNVDFEIPSASTNSSGKNIDHISNIITEDLSAATAELRLGEAKKLANSTCEDDHLVSYRLCHSGVLNEIEQSEEQYFLQGDSLKRNYLSLMYTSGATLICLPTPWMVPHYEADIDLLIDRNSVSGDINVSLTVGNPMINSILGYINMGAIHQATKFITLDRAQAMLFQKVSYPFTATLGGYLLVLGLNSEKYQSDSESWKQWIHNLYNWFEWLPDGAILYSALHFLLRDKNVSDAKGALLKAYDRGLPFFTFGLKLMMDGMRYFAREGDIECENRLQHLQTIAKRTDPSQPFLSIQYSQFNTAEESEPHEQTL